MATATLDGAYIFGQSVKCQHVPRPSAQQVSNFFGISGTQLVWGGTRGRGFFVSGVLVAPDIPSLAAVEALLLSYDDGIGRVLVDTWGRAWPAVVFSGQYQADPGGAHPVADGSGNWGLPYKASFFSLL